MIAWVVAEGTAEGVRAAFRRLAETTSADSALIELRLDAMTEPDPDLIRLAPRPVIATCRRPQERGLFAGSESEREALLRRALAAGAQHIDAELDVRETWTWLPAERTIVSVHDFEGRASKDVMAAVKLLNGGAAYAKIALKCTNLADLVHLRIAAQDAPGRLILVGLGEAGHVARALASKLKCPWTYVRADSESPPSPQLATLPSFADFETWGLLSAPPERTFGVLSDRAEDSIGPVAFNRLFQRFQISATYVPITSVDASSLKAFLLTWDLSGLSVTIPFKRAALSAADRISPLAKKVGAANTLYLEGTEWIAENTDVAAFRDGLLFGGAEALDGEILLVGAGGAARAAIVALLEYRRPPKITGRNQGRVAALAQEFGIEAIPMPSVPPRILINATPVGSSRDPHSMPVPATLVTQEQLVYDVTYAASPSPLARLARERGARLMTGLEMWALQAREQLELWFPGRSFGARALLEATHFALEKKFGPRK